MKKIGLFVILLFLLSPFSVFALEKETVTLKKCVDGDTAHFLVHNKDETVRFLAVDTPETKHPKKKEEPFGKEASEYTCKRLKQAKKIEIAYDPGSTKEDKYERLLAWIFVDGSLLQEELVTKGYAKVAYLYGDYQYTTLLEEKQQAAKEKQIGIWSEEQNRGAVQEKMNSFDLFWEEMIHFCEKIEKFLRKLSKLF